MALQKVVNAKLGFGVEGDIYDNSPKRCDPYIVSANGENPAMVGRAFTYTSGSPEKAVVGGENIFAGILVNSKEYARQGLTASLEVADGTAGELLSFGRVVVKVAQEFKAGYLGCYNTTTGEIGATATADGVPAGYAVIANSKFVLIDGAAAGLGVLQIGD